MVPKEKNDQLRIVAMKQSEYEALKKYFNSKEMVEKFSKHMLTEQPENVSDLAGAVDKLARPFHCENGSMLQVYTGFVVKINFEPIEIKETPAVHVRGDGL